jgi:CheY-like chemotaxis protein
MEMNESQDKINNKGFKMNTSENINYILIVDDEKLVRDSISFMINSICKELGINCMIVEGSDGKDILKHLKITDGPPHTPKSNDIKFKLLFTDEEMEHLNGSTVIKEIRKKEDEKDEEEEEDSLNYKENGDFSKNKSLIIVSITSNAAEIEKAKMIKESGADYVIQKPARKSQIRELVLLHLN